MIKGMWTPGDLLSLSHTKTFAASGDLSHKSVHSGVTVTPNPCLYESWAVQSLVLEEETNPKVCRKQLSEMTLH